MILEMKRTKRMDGAVLVFEDIFGSFLAPLDLALGVKWHIGTLSYPVADVKAFVLHSRDPREAGSRGPHAQVAGT